MRHAFGLDQLIAHRAVVGAATHREVVGRHHHRPAVDLGAADQQVRRRQIRQATFGIVFPAARQRAHLAKRSRIDHVRNAFAHRQLAALSVPAHLGLAPHALRQFFAQRQFLQFFVPGHVCSSLPVADAAVAARSIDLDVGALDQRFVLRKFFGDLLAESLW